MNQKNLDIVDIAEEQAVEMVATPVEVSEIAREERQVCICSTDFR
jgi:hypothetical protein